MVKIKLIFIGFCISVLCASCIMTKNPNYQADSSYLDTRYNELLYTSELQRLTSADINEAYMLSTLYVKKHCYKEAKSLLKIAFNSKKTLTFGLAYIDVLHKLGENREAKKVEKFLTVLYTPNEIQTQKQVFDAS
jgi:hypothetical protein